MMHYFKRNIGDYHKKAGRLTMLEHGAYTLLLDACYDRERFPTMEEAIDWCWARSKEEIGAVELVLRKFFDLIDGRYVQLRIQDEIDAYHAISLKNKEIAANREAAKRTKRAPSVNESAPNQEPLTINQEPIDQKPTSQATTGDLFPKFWALYPRKQDKAKAQKAWVKLKVTEDLFALIAKGLSVQVVSADWLKDSGKYIPLPTTWLNGKRWEDEVKVASNVHQFPGKSRHTELDQIDHAANLEVNADGSYRI
ncbi:YdaU family protein [Pseudomonas sp. ANT_J12]|uniref:YdaU family protein n=1 Tax=Pseudomonas sp. ANT_J12 TaxID=2597351 RepID=UPI00273DB74A|nr:YdaU family protein [Pseudomonas sp. ANT_J12]